MNDRLPEHLLSDLSERIARQMGLHFPRERWPELEVGLRAAAAELSVADFTGWAHSLAAAPLARERLALLARQLTIGETYFLREKPSLTFVSEHILPELIRARRNGERRLRIWSAGCCTGEEPFSIAILLDRLLPDFADWRVTILATDINQRFLEQASSGIFSEWSFRDAPAWLRERYFEPAGKNRLALLPRIRQRVTFAYLNLAEDRYPSLDSNTNALDLIFCRNVLMYFRPALVRRIVDRFFRALLEGGWLVVSPVETSAELFQQFTPVQRDGAILYQKRTLASAASIAACVPAQTPSPDTWFARPAVAPDDGVAQPVSPPTAAPERREVLVEPRLQPRVSEAAILQHALSLFEAGQYRQAAEHLAANQSQGAPNSERCMLEARIHANLGELKAARRWAEQAIATDKINPAAHHLRALILQEEGDSDEAIASLKRTLFLAADFVLAHFALGNIARQQGRHAEARRQFASVLALLEHHPDAEVLPHSDGLVAGRLREMVHAMMGASAGA